MSTIFTRFVSCWDSWNGNYSSHQDSPEILRDVSPWRIFCLCPSTHHFKKVYKASWNTDPFSSWNMTQEKTPSVFLDHDSTILVDIFLNSFCFQWLDGTNPWGISLGPLCCGEDPTNDSPPGTTWTSIPTLPGLVRRPWNEFPKFQQTENPNNKNMHGMIYKRILATQKNMEQGAAVVFLLKSI